MDTKDFNIGDKVRHAKLGLEGAVIGLNIDRDSSFMVSVEWLDEKRCVNHKWFATHEIEKVEA